MTGVNFKKELEEREYRGNILKTLLVSSVSGENAEFPTIKEFILSEIVNSVIEYTGGSVGGVRYSDFFPEKPSSFERHIFRYLEEELKSGFKQKLDDKLAKSIIKLCEPYFIFPGEGNNPYFHNELYEHINGFGCRNIYPKTEEFALLLPKSFLLPQEILIKVQREIMHVLSDQEKKDLKGIGKKMREYIDRDLKFIKKICPYVSV